MVSFPDPDGSTLIAVAHRNARLLVWDPAERTLRHELIEPLTTHKLTRAIATLTLPDGGTELLVAYVDGSVWRWNPFTAKPVSKLPPVSDVPVLGIAPYMDDTGAARVAISTSDGRVYVRHLDGTVSTATVVMEGARSGVAPGLLAYRAPDGRVTLACADGERHVWLINGTDLVAQSRPLRHQSTVRSVTTVSDADGGLMLATGGDNRLIRLWNSGSGEPVGRPLSGHQGVVGALTALPAPSGGRRDLLASASGDGTVRIWDVAELRGKGNRRTAASPFTSVVPLTDPDGDHRVVAAGPDGVRMWHPRAAGTNQFVETLSSADTPVVRKAMWHDGRELLLTPDPKGGARLWDPFPDRAQEYSTADSTAQANRKPDRWLIASAGADGSVRLWDTTDTTAPTEEIVQDQRVTAVAMFQSSGRPRVVLGRSDGAVHLWIPAAISPIVEVTSHEGPVSSITVVAKPRGEVFLANLVNGTLHVVRVSTGDVEGALECDSAVVVACSIPGPDNRALLAAGSADGTLRVWDAETRELVAGPVTAHRDRIFAVEAVLLADGWRVVTSGLDRSVRLWDPATGAALGQFELSGAPAHALTTFVDDEGEPRLATAADKTVAIWTTEGVAVPPSHSARTRVSSLISVSVPADRPLLAAADTTGRVELWDPVSVFTRAEFVTGQNKAILAALPVYDDNGTEGVAHNIRNATVVHYPAAAGSPPAVELAPHPEEKPRLVVAATPPHLRLWEFTTDERASDRIGGLDGLLRSALLTYETPAGSPRLAVVVDRYLRLYDLTTGRPSHKAVRLSTAVTAATVWRHRDGTSLLLAEERVGVVEWRPSTNSWTRTRLLRTGSTQIRVMAVLPGDVLATADSDQMLRFWHIPSRSAFAGVHLDASVTSLAPNGNGVVVGTDTGVLEIELRELVDADPAAVDLRNQTVPEANTPAPPVSSPVVARQLDAETLILSLVDAEGGEDGWVNLGLIGHLLRQRSPRFRIEDYGFTTLADYVRSLNKFELRYRRATPQSLPLMDIRRYVGPEKPPSDDHEETPVSIAENTSSGWPVIETDSSHPLAEDVVRRMVAEFADALGDKDGWVTLTHVGAFLKFRRPDFDTRRYGFAKLSTFVEHLGGFQIERRFPNDTNAAVVYIRKESA
jgi:WD40 repeat protein